MGSVYRLKTKKKNGRVVKRRIWMMQYTVHGQVVRESSGTTSKMKAQRICDGKETDGSRGIPVGPTVGKITFDEGVALVTADYAHNEYDTADALARRVRLHLEPAFGGDRLVEITVTRINAYITDRLAAGASVASINRETAILRRMFVLAVEQGLLATRPKIKKLQERNVRSGFFEREAFEAVRARLTPELQAVVTFAYITGWRIDSEVLPLEWAWVDFDGDQVTLPPAVAKNDEPRAFPMTDELRALLRARERVTTDLKAAGTITPYVFFRLVATKRGGAAKASPHRPKRITRFNKQWKHATIAAGCPGRIPHDFRRTAIRNSVRRGVPERVAMQMCGHKTRSVFERYNIVSPSDLAAARSKLDGLGTGGVWTKKDTTSDTTTADPPSAPTEHREKIKEFGGAARI